MNTLDLPALEALFEEAKRDSDNDRAWAALFNAANPHIAELLRLARIGKDREARLALLEETHGDDLTLGFEVRRKDAECTDDLGEPCSQEEWQRRVTLARATLARLEAGEPVRVSKKAGGDHG